MVQLQGCTSCSGLGFRFTDHAIFHLLAHRHFIQQRFVVVGLLQLRLLLLKALNFGDVAGHFASAFFVFGGQLIHGGLLQFLLRQHSLQLAFLFLQRLDYLRICTLFFTIFLD